MICLETRTFRWTLDDKGCTLAFVDKRQGTDHLACANTPCFALELTAGRRLVASHVSREGGQLLVRFAEAEAEAGIAVEEGDSTLVLRVQSLTGTDIQRFTFVDVPLDGRGTEPEHFSACTVSLDLQTRVDDPPGSQEHLHASCYPRYGVEGASVAILGTRFDCLRQELKQVVAASPNLPHSPLGGPWAMDAPENRNSYLFGVATEADVDDWIELCQDCGIGQLHFCGGGAFRIGDYEPNPVMFPDGIASVRRVIDKLHAAGIQAGLHTMSFSIAPNSRYVTPVPDPRLGTDNILTLAKPLGPDDTVVHLRENVSHLPTRTSYLIRRSMTLRLGEELITYAAVGEHELSGCVRGACGTTVAPHPEGTPAHHLKACWGLYAPGSDSLFTEIGANIANLINEADFDMVYLDGLDGVHIIEGEDGRWHFGGRHAFEVYERLKRPVVMEMAAFLHHLWFVRSRMGAWDHPGRGHKTFIDLHCRSNANFDRIFLPAHLGWWAPRVATGAKDEATYADDVAYLCTKAMAKDIGFSLQGMSPTALLNTPHLRRLTPTFRRFEELRRQGTVPASVREKLAEPAAEFALDDDEAACFRPVQRQDHKLSRTDGKDRHWRIDNRHAPQSPGLRLELLWQPAEYGSPTAMPLAELTTSGEFDDRSRTDCILNSGKDFSYPHAAPGVAIDLVACPLPQDAPDGLPCAALRASRVGSDQCLPASSPTDDLSLLDHGEKHFEPRPAGWARLGKRWAQEIDLTNHPALGFWLHGDGGGQTLNVQIHSLGRHNSFEDHYVPIDFQGWRYIRLLEPESERFEQLAWPYGRSVYELYRQKLEPADVCRIDLWFANLDVGQTAQCILTPIRALPASATTWERPRLLLGGDQVEFPVEMTSGQWLECQPDGSYELFSQLGETIASGQLPQPLPTVPTGQSTLVLDPDGESGQHRLRASLTTQGEPLV
jgi:hypothetical protein